MSWLTGVEPRGGLAGPGHVVVVVVVNDGAVALHQGGFGTA